LEIKTRSVARLQMTLLKFKISDFDIYYQCCYSSYCTKILWCVCFKNVERGTMIRSSERSGWWDERSCDVYCHLKPCPNSAIKTNRMFSLHPNRCDTIPAAAIVNALFLVVALCCLTKRGRKSFRLGSLEISQAWLLLGRGTTYCGKPMCAWQLHCLLCVPCWLVL